MTEDFGRDRCQIDLEYEDDQRQQVQETETLSLSELKAVTHTQSDDPNSCMLCGASSSYNYHKPSNGNGKNTPHWSVWRADCGRSLCKLLSLSGSEARAMMTKGPYCINCSCLVWDIHFTMTQLATLEQRLRSLKEKVEDKTRLSKTQTQLDGLRGGRQSGTDYSRVGWTSEVSTIRDLWRTNGAKIDGQNQENIEFEESYPLPFAQIKEHVDHHNFYQDAESEAASPVSEELKPAKRKPGRRRKNHEDKIVKIPNTDPDWNPRLDDDCSIPAEVNVNELSDDSDSDEELQTPKRRSGRGRPRRNFGDATQTKVERADSPREMTVKRRPGRRRKNLLEGESNEPRIDEHSVSGERVTLPKLPKKKPGRPRKHHTDPDDADPPTIIRRKQQVPEPCPVCSARCKTKTALSRHVEKEHPDYMYECSACSGKYKRAHLLEFHILNVHGRIHPFYCSVCRQGIETQEELTQHEAAHNSTSDPFVCLICQRVFTNSVDLEYHVLTHQRQHALKCTLPGCDKTFGTKDSLTRHVSRHGHGSHHDPRPFVCEVCGLGFRFPSLLARHRRTHSEGRHFCHLCPRSYKDADYLKEHMKMHTNPEAVRRFPCKVCGKSFRKLYHRARHEEIHAGTQSYICSACGKRFGTQAGLDSHVAVVCEPDPVLKEKRRLQKQGQWRRYYEKRKAEAQQ